MAGPRRQPEGHVFASVLAAVANICFIVVSTCIVVLLLPNSFVGKFWILRKLKAKVLKTCRRLGQLSAKGPVFQLFVFCGRRCGRGRFASQCRAPHGLRAQSTYCSHASVAWSPRVPLNPFHEEHYFLKHRIATDGPDAPWQERQLQEDDMHEVAKGRLKTVLTDLPEQALVEFQVCATNSHGRSDWSEVVQVEVLTRPNSGGGLYGPLGPAGQSCGDGRYKWTQSPEHVHIKVPISADWKAKDLSFKSTPARLEILVNKLKDSPDGVLLAGSFPKRVKADEVFWEIEDSEEYGRCISVDMTKAETMEKWPCVVQAPGHPHVDTAFLHFNKQMHTMGGLDLFE